MCCFSSSGILEPGQLCFLSELGQLGVFLKRGTTLGASINFVYISGATKCPLDNLGAEQSSGSEQTF